MTSHLSLPLPLKYAVFVFDSFDFFLKYLLSSVDIEYFDQFLKTFTEKKTRNVEKIVLFR